MRYGSADYRAAVGVMRGVLVRVLAEHYDEVLPAIACPVDLLWGADDREVPVEVAQRAVGLFPHATLEVVAGAGHLTPIEVPESLLRVVTGTGGTAAPLSAGEGTPSAADEPADAPAEGGRASASP